MIALGNPNDLALASVLLLSLDSTYLDLAEWETHTR